MLYTIRPWRAPDDFEAVHRLYALIEANPMTVQEIQEWDESFPADGHRTMLVAETAHGDVVGYAEATHRPWDVKFYFEVIVDPDHRRQGLGAELYRRIETFAREQGATALEYSVKDSDQESLAFAERRGFAVRRHLFESVLDPVAFPLEQFWPAVTAAEAKGFRFTTYEKTRSPEIERELYSFKLEAEADIPGMEGNPSPFEVWKQEALDHPRSQPHGRIFALVGEVVAGSTVLKFNDQTGEVYTGMTGVRRAYRNQGLALALKVLSIQVARECGAKLMRTNNDSENAPMLAVNRKLGYTPCPGNYVIEKKF